VTSFTTLARRGASISLGLMNLAFVHGPAAAPTPRHSTARSTRPTKLGPRSRPPSSNKPSSAKPFRGGAELDMETQRLRAIRHPNRIASLLESWVSSRGIIPVKARRIRDLSDLSKPLRRLAHRCNGDESGWCSWTNGRHTWFVAATFSLELARERKKPVLQIKIYNECGQITAAAAYVHTLDHGWQRCA
jgi:hypothetical protein